MHVVERLLPESAVVAATASALQLLGRVIRRLYASREISLTPVSAEWLAEHEANAAKNDA